MVPPIVTTFTRNRNSCRWLSSVESKESLRNYLVFLMVLEPKIKTQAGHKGRIKFFVVFLVKFRRLSLLPMLESQRQEFLL